MTQHWAGFPANRASVDRAPARPGGWWTWFTNVLRHHDGEPVETGGRLTTPDRARPARQH